MKKVFSFVLIAVMLINGVFVVSANGKTENVDISNNGSIVSDEYGCSIFPCSEVFYYDSENNYGIFMIIISTEELKCYEYVQYDVFFNKNIIQYESIVFADIGVYSRDYIETDDGFSYKVSIPKESSEWTPDGDYVQICCKITGLGDIDFGVNSFAVLPDGEKKELSVKISPFYNKIIDISEIEFINASNINAENGSVNLLDGMIAQELLDMSKNKSVVIKDRNNVIIDNNEMISNGAYIATVFEGYIVDRIDIIVKSDVDCDGDVTAADARLALRHSAQLDTLSGVAYFAADVDGVQGITASDARLILRKAAKLDN